MSDQNEESQEVQEEIMPLPTVNSRRQRQKLRFSQDTEEKGDEEQQHQQPRSPSSFRFPTRANRFLSIADPSIQLPIASLLRLRQLHSRLSQDNNALISEEITDELLDKLPFRYMHYLCKFKCRKLFCSKFRIEIIPERKDDMIDTGSSIKRARQKRKESMEVPKVMPSGLSEKRRLEIIEDILKRLSQQNIIDELRRENAIPCELPK